LIPEAEDDLSIETRPPREEEITAAVKPLRNHKTLGEDRLSAELFKADAVTTASNLQPLFTGKFYKKPLTAFVKPIMGRNNFTSLQNSH